MQHWPTQEVEAMRQTCPRRPWISLPYLLSGGLFRNECCAEALYFADTFGVVKLCLQRQAVNLSLVVTASQELGSEAEPAHVTKNRSLMGRS